MKWNVLVADMILPKVSIRACKKRVSLTLSESGLELGGVCHQSLGDSERDSLSLAYNSNADQKAAN